jgi:hypothetical protein
LYTREDNLLDDFANVLLPDGPGRARGVLFKVATTLDLVHPLMQAYAGLECECMTGRYEG